MGVTNVLRNQNILLIFYLCLFCHHLYPSPTCLIGRFQNPELIIGILPCWLKSLEVRWEYVCIGNKVITVRVDPFSFVQIFPHIIFSTKLPTAWEMVDFLVLVGIFKSLLVMNPRSIEKNIPIRTDFTFLESVEFKGIDDTPVFWSLYFVFSNHFF